MASSVGVPRDGCKVQQAVVLNSQGREGGCPECSPSKLLAQTFSSAGRSNPLHKASYHTRVTHQHREQWKKLPEVVGPKGVLLDEVKWGPRLAEIIPRFLRQGHCPQATPHELLKAVVNASNHSIDGSSCMITFPEDVAWGDVEAFSQRAVEEGISTAAIQILGFETRAALQANPIKAGTYVCTRLQIDATWGLDAEGKLTYLKEHQFDGFPHPGVWTVMEICRRSLGNPTIRETPTQVVTPFCGRVSVLASQFGLRIMAQCSTSQIWTVGMKTFLSGVPEESGS